LLIEISKENLLACLQVVSRAVPTRSVIAALGGILLQAEGNGLQITGNDLEISISTESDCLVKEEGEAVLPARLLTEAVRRSPGDTIRLQLLPERNLVQLVSGPMQMEILALSTEDFPEEAEVAAEKSYIIPQIIAKNMIRQVDFAISSEDLQPILTGALWSFDQGELKMTALDGYRLASRWSALPSAAHQPAKVVVPAKALRELMRLLTDEPEMLHVRIGGTYVAFEFNQVRLVSRLLQGQFPNTEQFIPASYQTRAILNANELLAAIERAALVSKEGSNGSVKLTVEENRLTVSAQSMDIGRHFEEWPIQSTGEDLQIMYNIKSLGELLRSAESEEVVIDFHGINSPT
jgi:DNA polymerase-3 subunit beta